MGCLPVQRELAKLWCAIIMTWVCRVALALHVVSLFLEFVMLAFSATHVIYLRTHQRASRDYGAHVPELVFLAGSGALSVMSFVVNAAGAQRMLRLARHGMKRAAIATAVITQRTQESVHALARQTSVLASRVSSSITASSTLSLPCFAGSGAGSVTTSPRGIVSAPCNALSRSAPRSSLSASRRSLSESHSSLRAPTGSSQSARCVSLSQSGSSDTVCDSGPSALHPSRTSSLPSLPRSHPQASAADHARAELQRAGAAMRASRGPSHLASYIQAGAARRNDAASYRGWLSELTPPVSSSSPSVTLRANELESVRERPEPLSTPATARNSIDVCHAALALTSSFAPTHSLYCPAVPA